MNGFKKFVAVLAVATLSLLGVNAIAPGFVNNEMMVGGLTATQQNFFIQKTLLRRFAENDEIAKTCLFLLTQESSYMTAEIIEVSAGQKIG
jgi:NAD(P)-dependent dehydrogenase (short-subunit alcohol dehydrogenase family)